MLVFSVLAILFSYSRADITSFESCTYTTTNGQCGGTATCIDICVESPATCAVGFTCADAFSAYSAAGMSEYGVCYLYYGSIDNRVTCEESGGGGNAATDPPTNAATDPPTNAATSGGGGNSNAATDAPTNAATSGGNGTDADTSGGGGGSDAGTVAGIVIGCIVGVAVIGVIVYFVYKKKAL